MDGCFIYACGDSCLCFVSLNISNDHIKKNHKRQFHCRTDVPARFRMNKHKQVLAFFFVVISFAVFFLLICTFSDYLGFKYSVDCPFWSIKQF